MPFSLEGAQTQDAYSDQCELQPDKNTIQCSFYCLDNPVIVQVFKRNPRMPLSQPVWDGIERFYQTGGGDTFVGPIGGVKFRSANAGQSARIFGVQTFATDVTSMASGFGGSSGSPFELDTTDGVTDVNPTTQLFIADGIFLENPVPGQAYILVNLDSPDGSIIPTYNGPTNPVDLKANQYLVRAAIVQSTANRDALGGSTQDHVVFPSTAFDGPPVEHRMTLATFVYPKVNGTISLHLTQLSGASIEVVAGMQAMLIGDPVGGALGTVNTTQATDATTSPAPFSVPTGNAGVDAVFSTSQFDTAGMLTLAPTATEFVATIAGTYLVVATVVWLP